MLCEPAFSAADQQRFRAIKAELRRRLPDTLPRSEEIQRCALLFSEVRDKSYQHMDGHEDCGPWMHALFKVGERQADKYFHAASLSPEEVAGKHQGVEVMAQIAQEKDPKVREAMWELAEAERVSDKALGAGRKKARPYLDKGRRKQGIAALLKAARRGARYEAEVREKKKSTPRRAGERGREALDRTDRAIARLLSGKGEVTREDVEAMVGTAEGLVEKVGKLAEQHGIPWKFQTSEKAREKGGEAPQSPTEEPAKQEPALITQAPPVEAVPRTSIAPALQLPAEVLAFRPLFRFFHEGLTPGRQDAVQYTLCAVVRGDHADFRILEMHRALRPFLPDGHPAKKQMSKLAAGLRAEGMAGRRFALYCLIAAGLPGLGERLVQLAQMKLPEGIGEMVRYYRNLILGMS